MLVAQFCPTLCNSMDPMEPARLLCPWNSPGKNTRVGGHSLLQEVFPTQGSNPGLLHCRQILYHLTHQGVTLKNLLIPQLNWYRSLKDAYWQYQVSYSTYKSQKRHTRPTIISNISYIAPSTFFSSAFELSFVKCSHHLHKHAQTWIQEETSAELQHSKLVTHLQEVEMTLRWQEKLCFEPICDQVRQAMLLVSSMLKCDTWAM